MVLIGDRLVRDLTPPSKPDNIKDSKDRREFNRNKPVNTRASGRYGGGGAAKRTGGKVTGAVGGWKKGDDNSAGDDEIVLPKKKAEYFEIPEEYDEPDFEDEEEFDEDGQPKKRQIKPVGDEDDEDVNSYAGFVNSAGQEEFAAWDFVTRYEEGAKAGMYLKKKKGRSDLDHMFKNALWESYKTESGTFVDAFHLSNYKRVQIPKPRSMKKLLFAQMSNIRHAGAVDTPGYKNAEAAWSVSVSIANCSTHMLMRAYAGGSQEYLLLGTTKISSGRLDRHQDQRRLRVHPAGTPQQHSRGSLPGL